MASEELVERRRREIADAAAVTFAEKGYHATGIADIARQLGIGHGTFYRYFKNKLDILEFVVERVMRQLTEVLAAEDPQQATTLEEYRAQATRIGRGLFELFEADPAVARLYYVEAVGADKELTERWLQTQAILGKITQQYLDNGVSRGFLPADLDTQITARAINGMVFAGGLVGIARPSQHEPSLRDRWVDAITRLMFEGIVGRS